MFRDRREAGVQLAGRLEHLRGNDVLVLAIPRGGVPVGAEIALQLEADLDVMVARKVGAPFQPELAVGAVTASGGYFVNEDVVYDANISPGALRAAIAAEAQEAGRQEQRLRGARPSPRISGRTVIIVDDGLATGATMHAAVRSIRQHQPAKVVVAVPVAPPATVVALRLAADEVIAVEQPDPFLAVGLHYADFRPTDEGEIEQLLQAYWPAH